MATEEQKALWRLSSKQYYAKNSKNINLWKAILLKAKKRGLVVPKLSQSDLIKHTPIELVEILKLPSDLISPRQLARYNNKTPIQTQPEG